MKTILITEDDPIIAADIQSRLKGAGYKVQGAYDGATALRLASTQRPSLVLLDVNLGSGLTGIEVAEKLRTTYPTLPLVYLTSNSDEVTFHRARATSPQGFISKPFRGVDLLHTVALVLDRSEREVGGEHSAKVEPESGHGHLLIRHGERSVRVPMADILLVEADDYYCKVHTKEQVLTATMTLKKFSLLLPEPPFLRVHRSYVVNRKHVTAVDENYLYLGDTRVPVSRGKRAAVRQLLAE